MHTNEMYVKLLFISFQNFDYSFINFNYLKRKTVTKAGLDAVN